MYVFKKVEDLREYLALHRKKGHSIGFVPTMGALHKGHISLIEAANKGSDITVCSIFVNPTQFDNAEDLQKYNRNLPKDAELLGMADADVLFAPSVQEIYPPNLVTEIHLDFGQLTKVLEGKFRTGHFEGMVQVVSRLLDILEPDSLYMGQKDFQQAAIVMNMLEQQNRPVRLVVCPIIREGHGLAMSSRNARLAVEERKISNAIHEALLTAKAQLGKVSIEDIQKKAIADLEATGFKPEYFEVVDGNSLVSLTEASDSSFVVACVAAYMGEVRLIDNMVLKQA